MGLWMREGLPGRPAHRDGSSLPVGSRLESSRIRGCMYVCICTYVIEKELKGKYTETLICTLHTSYILTHTYSICTYILTYAHTTLQVLLA